MPSIKPQFLKRRPRREYLDDRYKPRKPVSLIWFKRFILVLLLLSVGVFILLLSGYAYANTNIDEPPQVSMDQVSGGNLLVKAIAAGQYKPVPLLHTEVNMDVSGMIIRSQVKQYFENTSDDWIEAVYVFPLPATAAVDHLRMKIGERIIIGEIKSRAQARRIYNKARREGKKAALVEQHRPNLFTHNVANIGPGETIMIEIEYQQTLQYEQGDFSLRFPMAITPRYIPGKALNEKLSLSGSGWAQNTGLVSDASHITPPLQPTSNPVNPVSINIKLNPGFPLLKLNSRYHRIVQQHKNNITHISLAEGNTVSDRDFELVWSPQIKHIPKAAVFKENIHGEHYQMLMLMPPDNGGYDGQPLAREVTYIIDTSGSMHGVSMQQAKQALLMALDRLRLHDKFNIIQFNSITDELFSRAQLASFENIILARQYINRLQANGGTEMVPALKLALNNPPENNLLHQIIFLTDGSVGNETQLFDIIHKKLGKSRLFTIGIGSAPNSYFMRKAAQFGRGSFTYISDINEVNEKMSALFNKLESPLMTNISFQFDDSIKTEIWPQRIPDLYRGEPIILAIKSNKALNNIKVSGTRALAPWSASLNLSNSKSSKGIGTFWARKKIASLSDSLRGGANPNQVRNNITEVALQHHLVSKHTSLVAVDHSPSRNSTSKLNKQTMPVNLPHGQNAQKIFGRLAQTATYAELHLIIGFTLLMLGLALAVLLRKPESSFSEKNVT
jgi:Ca-activated chloride channel homolog